MQRNKTTKTGTIFTVFYFIAALTITFLSIWERGTRSETKVPVITYAQTSQYVLLIAAAVILLVCALFTYIRGNLRIQSVLIRRSIPCGIAAVLTGSGFLYQTYQHFFTAQSTAGYVLSVLCLLSALFLFYLSSLHFAGGSDGVKNRLLLGILLPLVYFLLRLILLFFSDTSFYPTVDNVLEQIIMTLSLLFFLGYGKDIWVSGAEYGHKLMIITGLFAFVLVLVRIVGPVLFYLMQGDLPSALSLLNQMALYLPLSLYMLGCGVHILYRAI